MGAPGLEKNLFSPSLHSGQPAIKIYRKDFYLMASCVFIFKKKGKVQALRGITGCILRFDVCKTEGHRNKSSPLQGPSTLQHPVFVKLECGFPAKAQALLFFYSSDLILLTTLFFLAFLLH